MTPVVPLGRAWQAERRLVSILLIATLGALLIGLPSLALGKDVPLARDGRVDRAVFNGQQNMPVSLLGVAQDWHRDCFRGRTRECEKLADAFATGLGDLRPDHRISAGYLLKGCELGSAASCTEYAAQALGGALPLPSPEPAVTSAQRGCEAFGEQASCAWLGVIYSRGEGLARDGAMAESLWRAACGAGADEGCRFLAAYQWERATSGEAGNEARQEAERLFNAACSRDARPWACLGSARAADVTTQAGIALLERGCKQGKGDTMQVCAEYAAQTLGSKDKSKVDFAEGVLNSACTAGVARSCFLIGRHGFSPDARIGDVTPGEAGHYLRRGCDLDHPAACYELARAYINGRMPKRQEPVSTMLMLKSCDLGHQPACDWKRTQPVAGAMANIIRLRWIDPSLPAAEQLEQAIRIADSDPGKAAQTVGMLMEEDYEEAEWLLGNWFLTGKRGIVDTPNQRNAVILIENAARVGHVEAAKWMGMAHWYGRYGVANDRKLGLGYMRIAARFGDEEALLIVTSMELQPERDRIAAQKRAAEQARIEREQRHWFSRWAESVSFRSPTPSRNGISLAQRQMAESNQRAVASMDRLYWNQRLEYLTGATTACNRSNPYC